MKERRILISVLALGLLLALAVGLSQAQGPEPPEGDVRPQGETGATAIVGGAIPIQGRLTDADGNPLPDGDYTLTFRLYDIVVGGTPLCVDVDGPPGDPSHSVHVADGLFAASMDSCTADVLNGQQLYLGIEVGDDGEMTPRQYIYPVPYAWSLRPGAVINGDVAGDSVLQVHNASRSNGSKGVYGRAYGVTGVNYGVYGESYSADGYGGYFVSTTYSGSGVGVYAYSSNGYAGFFSGKVGQSREDGGLVKAAVMAFCDDNNSEITRSFNNVNSTSIAIFNGLSNGTCVIDFGSRINDRYFVATALSSAGGSARGVSCYWGGDDEKLQCGIWDTAGNGVSGLIMVLIY